MAFEEFKENVSEINTHIRDYIDRSIRYYELRGFKILMIGITSFTKAIILGAILLIAILLFSFAASFAIGQMLGNIYYGFLITGLFYLVIGILFYLFRKNVDKLLLKKFSKNYFDKL